MKYLYRLTPGYLRSLVLLLQGSDYRSHEFWRWWRRTKDFRRVTQRQQVDWTAKARLILSVLLVSWVVIWIDIALFGWLAVYGQWWFALAAAIGVALLPVLLAAVGMAAASWITIAQQPLITRTNRRTRHQLEQHRGIKIAIAGSYGKTTMKEILKTVLAQGKKVAAAPGNLNTPLGVARFVQSLDGGEDVLLFEFGEYYPGDVAELAELVQPDYGLITGVNEAHLERFKSIDHTAATIFELAEAVPSDRLYVNAESRFVEDRLDKHVGYDSTGCGLVSIKDVEVGLMGTDFRLGIRQQHRSIHTNLLGAHQLGPLAAAAALASRLDLTFDQIVAGIEAVAPFEHRLQPRPQQDGSLLIDDSYNGNPDGVRAVIAWLQRLPERRRIYITPGLVEMGPDRDKVHEEIGAELADAVEIVALVRTSATPAIERGLKKAKFKGKIWQFDDMSQCLAALPAHQLPNDAIVIQNDWPDSYA